jgi:hypothetical protein
MRGCKRLDDPVRRARTRAGVVGSSEPTMAE